MYFDEPFGGIIPGARGAVLAALLRTGTALTGRQVHGLMTDRYSLWTVQGALKALTQLGLVHAQTIGRASVHTINADHFSVPSLRILLDPVQALRDAIGDVIGGDVAAVVLFGSIARGEATPGSDVDLAVIAPGVWDKRVELEDTIRKRLGNNCDVLVFTAAEFDRLAAMATPIVNDILRDGIALVGTKPLLTPGAA